MARVPTSVTTPFSLSDPSSSLSSTMSSVSASGSSGSTSTSTGPDPPSSSTALNSSPTIASSDSASSAPSSSTTPTSSSTSSGTTTTTSSSTTEQNTSTTPTDTTSSISTSNTSTPTPPTTAAVPTSSTSDTSSSLSSTGTSASSASSSSVPLSTIVQTTIITQNGQTSTIVTSQIAASGTVGANGSSSSSGNGSDSHTGAIVGGVVGGIAFIVLLALLAWFIRRRRNKSEFDGNFDPDHVAKRDSSPLQRLGRGGDADLLAAAHGVDEPEVTPYTYGMQQQQPGSVSLLGPAAAAGLGAGAGYAAGQGYGGRDQKGAGPLANNSYYNPNAPAMPSGPSEAGSGSGSGHGLNDPRTSMSSSGGVPYGASPYPPVSGPGAGAAYGMGMPIPGMYQPSPAAGTPSLPTSHSTYSSYSGVPSKELEAFAARYAQQVGQGQGQNVPYGGAGASGSAPLTLRNGAAEDEAQNVVVHLDGGRVREDVAEPMNEIPPTYDSIRSDEERH